MSDDVEARFAAVRVSFGTVHKILCEGDQSTRVREYPSVPASPAKQVQVFRKNQDLMRGRRQSIARDHQRVVGTFRKSLKGPPVQSRTPSTCRVARLTSGSIARDPTCPETFRYVCARK